MSETSPITEQANPITEQANPETELARDRCSPEDLPPDALQTIPRTKPVVQVSEQINAKLENLSVGAGRTQVAGSLRGVDDEDEWRHALEKLKESNFGDMEDKVFRVLRISYDQLDDFALQQSLLYCALFPEGHEIEREELIDCLIDEGIIEKMGSREAAFHKGHAMLDRLENAGFLQRIDGGRAVKMRAVKMHDLVRDMAIRICKENPSDKGMEQGGEEGRVCSQLDVENTGEGSAQHVDRTVPPTIDEKYNRREATEILVQHGVGASSFGVYGNNDAISTSQQEQNKEVDNNEVTNVISASAQQQNNEMMMAHQRGDLSLEDWMASITVEDEDLQVIGNFHERPSFNQADEPRGDPSQPTNDQFCSPSVNNDVSVNDAQNVKEPSHLKA